MGSLCLGLGILGVFLPILPTTPFLLLATALYVRSSKRLYYWVMNNRWLGRYVKYYREGKGIPPGVKILTICLLWITMGYSVVFIVKAILLRLILILIAIGVTIHILSFHTLRHGEGDEE